MACLCFIGSNGIVIPPCKGSSFSRVLYTNGRIFVGQRQKSVFPPFRRVTKNSSINPLKNARFEYACGVFGYCPMGAAPANVDVRVSKAGK